MLQRALALGQIQANTPIMRDAQTFHVTRRTIQHLIRKFGNTGDVKDLPRSGRPKVTSHQQDHYMIIANGGYIHY